MGTARIYLAAGAALLAVVAADAQEAKPAAPVVRASAETEPTQQGGANMAVVAPGREQPANSRIIGTAALAGLELYALDGKRLGSAPAGEAIGVDVRHGIPLAGRDTTLVASIDATNNSLRLFALGPDGLSDVAARALPLGFAAENVCLYRSAIDGGAYAFVVGDGGEIDQQLLYAAADGRVDARQVRRLHLPSPAEYCVVDDARGQLYVAEETVGLWRFNADPEAEAAPALVDAPSLGNITEELGGVAHYDGGDRGRWLFASDASSGRIFLYDRDKDDAFAGAVSIASPDGAALAEPAGLFAASTGVLVVGDDDAGNYKLVSIDAIADALKLAPAAAAPAPPPASVFPALRAHVETEAVPSSGDAADDPAIWANPANPAESLVIGTDKRAGLHVYDMSGRILNFAADGKMNNVDLRDGFKLGGRDVILVTASDRTNKAIAIYTLDTAAKRLVNVADAVQPTGLSDPYGQCMYRSRRDGKFYVFVGDPDGLLRQWELMATKQGKVRTRLVREVRFGSQAEGCVADDATGRLYVAEEDVGFWTLSAEPNGGTAKRSLDTVATNPNIKDDLEGVGLYDLGDGRGYLIVSSQGNNSYAVYRREGDQAYLGSFKVVVDGARGIDGISETDGLEVTSRNLGPGFEHGAIIAQDGRNVLPSENQNFKYVAWDDIADALKLERR